MISSDKGLTQPYVYVPTKSVHQVVNGELKGCGASVSYTPGYLWVTGIRDYKLVCAHVEIAHVKSVAENRFTSEGSRHFIHDGVILKGKLPIQNPSPTVKERVKAATVVTIPLELFEPALELIKSIERKNRGNLFTQQSKLVLTEDENGEPINIKREVLGKARVSPTGAVSPA